MATENTSQPDGAPATTNRGSLTAQSLLIGNQLGATGAAAISGAGSTLTINTDAEMGNSGQGNPTAASGGSMTSIQGMTADVQGAGGVNVNSGAMLTVGDLEIGPLSRSIGDVSIPGVGPTITDSFLTVGDGAKGNNPQPGGARRKHILNGSPFPPPPQGADSTQFGKDRSSKRRRGSRRAFAGDLG